MRILSICLVAMFLLACSEPAPATVDPASDAPKESANNHASANSSAPAVEVQASDYCDNRNAYFGDTHVHTMYSFDAFIFGTTASPDQAYEFAKGAALQHPGGFSMQLKQPLDFYAVTDHGFYLGALREMADPSTKLSKHDIARGMDKLTDAVNRRDKFTEILGFIRSERAGEILNSGASRRAWSDIKNAANRHNDPGNFTVFIAYEYTASGDEFENLHRNVIFKGDKGPELPFSRLDSGNPEDLWSWMDKQRDLGFESLAIPHNSNGSNGQMFKLLDFTGNPT